MKQGTEITFYMYELQKYEGLPLYEYLLRLARKQDICKCVVLRGVAGFDIHGKLHEEKFFELAADVPVAVRLIDSAGRIDLFINKLKACKLDIFYTKTAVAFGIIEAG